MWRKFPILAIMGCSCAPAVFNTEVSEFRTAVDQTVDVVEQYSIAEKEGKLAGLAAEISTKDLLLRFKSDCPRGDKDGSDEKQSESQNCQLVLQTIENDRQVVQPLDIPVVESEGVGALVSAIASYAKGLNDITGTTDSVSILENVDSLRTGLKDLEDQIGDKDPSPILRTPNILVILFQKVLQLHFSQLRYDYLTEATKLADQWMTKNLVIHVSQLDELHNRATKLRLDQLEVLLNGLNEEPIEYRRVELLTRILKEKAALDKLRQRGPPSVLINELVDAHNHLTESIRNPGKKDRKNQLSNKVASFQAIRRFSSHVREIQTALTALNK